jgi:hypothetical protein
MHTVIDKTEHTLFSLKAKDISLALAAGKEAGAVIPLEAKVLEL